MDSTTFLTQVSDASTTVSDASTTGFAMSRLTPVSMEHFSRESSNVDDGEGVLNDILQAIADECVFFANEYDLCVSVTDPRKDDSIFAAVSDRFEALTGFGKNEIIGKSCRFLNVGSDAEVVDTMSGYGKDVSDRMALQTAEKTGAHYSTVLKGRRKSGELFLNMVDLQGLTIAQNPLTNEELFILVGIHFDISSLCESEVPTKVLADLRTIGSSMRSRLSERLNSMALGDNAVSACSQTSWRILQNPIWRAGMVIEHAMRSLASACTPITSNESKAHPPTQVSAKKLVMLALGIGNIGALGLNQFPKDSAWQVQSGCYC